MFFEIARILEAKRPKYFLLENVKGLLNHDGGKTFTIILRTLEELGFSVQWMVLNSKFFGVPQNRERVFIIGNLRGEPRPEILPFRENAEKVSGISGEEETSRCITSRYQGYQNPKDIEKSKGQLIYKFHRANEIREYKDESPCLTESHEHNGGTNVPCLTQNMGTGGNNVPMVQGMLPIIAKKRKFDTPKEINQFLKNNKGNFTLKKISKKLKIPKTQIEHYFRTDGSRAVPSPELWKKLKEILNFDDTYDRQVTKIYEKEVEYEMNRRVYSEKGISPTLKTDVPMVYDNQGRKEKMSISEVCPTIRKGTYGNVPMVVAQRGRKNGQEFEPRTDATNSLTSVQKDNLVSGTVTQAFGRSGCSREEMASVEKILILCDGRDNRSCLRSGRTTELGISGKSLRRLTPMECERLQSFPDDWTKYGINKKDERIEISDTQRYKMMGNAVTVNVIKAIIKNMFEIKEIKEIKAGLDRWN